MNLRQLFLQNVAQTSIEPLSLEFTRAQGIYLYDKNNRPYIDFISGIAVSNVGHCHPKVVEAIKNQSEKYLHQMVFGEYVQSPQVHLAEALVKTLKAYKSPNFGKIDNVYFCNSGTEAIEGAMKLAKRFTFRDEIISLHNSYHGSTQGALSLGEDFFKKSYEPLLPEINKVERNSFEDLTKITNKTAAVIIEPIGGESGVRESDILYLKALRQKCTETGTLLVFDEVQTGIGRTGKFWSFEHYDCVPDILVSAKGLGGGMPIGAFMSPKSIMESFKTNPILGHITTFGGHPVSCAAALACLDIINNEIDLENIEKKGELIKSLLKHTLIKEVRGKGLMLAAEFENFDILKKAISKTIEDGLISDWFLYCDNAMRIAPPLVISEEEIHNSCKLIVNALNKI